MPQPNLRIYFDGLEEATPGMPCYDPAQPWFAHVTVVNANLDPKWPAQKRALDPQNPTAAVGPFKVFFQVFPGQTSKSTSGSTPFTTYTVDGLGAYPGGQSDCAQGFSMQLPQGMAKADFGVKYGFMFQADMYQAVTESNEDDNYLVWESGLPPPLAPQWKEGDTSPFSNLKFAAFKAVPGSRNQLDVLVKNQGSETSFQLELRLSIMGPPTPVSPTGSVAESVSANSTAIPSGGSTWVRFKARSVFLQPRAALSARELQRLQSANPASRRFRQVQLGSSSLLGGQSIARYLVVDKDFDFVPLKPFFITLMNATQSEKVAFGESPLGAVKRPGPGGPIAIPRKDR
jgi:hypothetical protein